MSKKVIVRCAALLLPLLSVATSLQADSKAESRLENIKHRLKGPTVKVLLLQDVEGALVEVKGAYNVYDPRTGKKLDSAFSSSSYYLHPTTDGIKWGQEFPGIFQIMIVPDNSETAVLVRGIEYHGMIYAYQIDGTIGFVNEVSLDQYADALVATLCQGKVSEPEAIAALTIAARSDALYRSQHGKTKYWDIQASQIDYQGSALTRHDKAYKEALQATSKMVLKVSQPIAWFAEGGSAPLEEIEAKAKEGKDARAILQDYFPDCRIELART